MQCVRVHTTACSASWAQTGWCSQSSCNGLAALYVSPASSSSVLLGVVNFNLLWVLSCAQHVLACDSCHCCCAVGGGWALHCYACLCRLFFTSSALKCGAAGLHYKGPTTSVMSMHTYCAGHCAASADTCLPNRPRCLDHCCPATAAVDPLHTCAATKDLHHCTVTCQADVRQQAVAKVYTRTSGKSYMHA
jgi:hypothetical protein